LVSVDALLQPTRLLVSPSVFVKSLAIGATPNQLESNKLFACPECGGSLKRMGDTMVCEREGRRWAVRDGIYDFKAPIDEA
jgi:hypothetical protein